MIRQVWETLLYANASIIEATPVLAKHYRAKADVKTSDGWGGRGSGGGVADLDVTIEETGP